jgi:hypothetical protein
MRQEESYQDQQKEELLKKATIRKLALIFAKFDSS